MAENIEQILEADPLGNLARKERKALLISSAVAFAMAKAGIVPSQISFLTIEVTEINEIELLRLIIMVVSYFLLSFVLHALPDFLRWKVQIAEHDLRGARHRWEYEEKYGSDYDEPTPDWKDPPDYYEKEWKSFSMRRSWYLNLTQLKALVLDVILPVVIGMAAIMVVLKAIF
ncbi:MAG TPA: hypothetical protein PK224_00205 [Nitrospira sp.]|jgi:hypothetical protein|nr:hypothetical protein [Nitrospira sp.]